MRQWLVLIALVVVLLAGCTKPTSTTSEPLASGDVLVMEAVDVGDPVKVPLDWYGEVTTTVRPRLGGMVELDVDLNTTDSPLEQPFLDLHAALSEFPDAVFCQITYWPKDVSYIWDSRFETLTMHLPPLGEEMGERPVAAVANGVSASLVESVAEGDLEPPAFAPPPERRPGGPAD